MNDPRTTPSILTRGAIDLGALRAPANPPPATGPGDAVPGGSGGPAIDVTEATFQTDVMERSLSIPVVVEFWTDRSPQGAQLSVMLNRLAEENADAWVLARVNVDTEPRLTAMFRVQSVPTVYAVIGGQPVDAFTGVIPEAQLRQWIAAICQAGGVAVEAPEDPRFADADEALLSGDLVAAEAAYRQILADAPTDAGAEAGLAQVALLRRVEGVDSATALAAAAEAPDDVAAQGLAADIEVLSGEAERAYARLVELVRRTAGAERDAARAYLISLFTMAGPDDPAVAAARRALASALF